MTNECLFLAVINSGCDEWWGSDMMWWDELGERWFGVSDRRLVVANDER